MQPNRRAFLQRAGIVGTGLVTGSSAVGQVVADEDAGADATDEDAALAQISGTVRDFGRPVEDVTITATPTGGSGDEDDDSDRSVDTGSSGSYELDLEPGTYVLDVSGDGYEDVTGVIDVSEGEAEPIDVSLEREWGPGEGELEVYATEIGGGPTIPCEVTVYGDEEYGTPAPRGSVPDGDNWNKGFVVSEGWWEVRVSDADGYADGYANVYVEDGETATATVELAELDELEDEDDGEIPDVGQFIGTVTDEDGDPIESAAVTVDDRWARTDADGEFELELDHGRHSMTVYAPEYERTTGRVEVRFARTTRTTISLASER